MRRGFDVLKRLGTVTGLAGAVMVAGNFSFSGWGYVPFLVSSACWVTVASRSREWSLAAREAGFVAINIVGIYRWLLT